MKGRMRVGTIYLPVCVVKRAKEWYEEKVGIRSHFVDRDKAIFDFANLSFFLVRSPSGQTSDFIDAEGVVRPSLTLEVDGVTELEEFRTRLIAAGVSVGELEDRGHPGRNFIFFDLDGNRIDVWSGSGEYK
ncbi:UNVERIFIED_CONTAM: VOC family protein [Halobacillus marinus]